MFLGYSPTLVVTTLVYQATGFSGSTFVLKPVVAVGIVWHLTYTKENMKLLPA